MHRKASAPALHISKPNRLPVDPEDLITEEEANYLIDRYEDEQFVLHCAIDHSIAHLWGRRIA